MFRDRGSHRSYGNDKFTLVYPRQRPQRPGYRDRCELPIFLLHDEPRVFVGGSEWGFDGSAREADAVEIEALAERFDLAELREVLDRARPPLPPAQKARDNPPMQRTGRGGILSLLRRLWAGR